MAKFLITFRKGLTLGLLAWAGWASAEILADPTRPPTAMIPSKALASGELTGPVLQSVLVSHGRKIAIISGKEVKENEKFNGARVVRISDTEVVLRSGRQVQVLKLFPDVTKQKVQSDKRKVTKKRSNEKRSKE